MITVIGIVAGEIWSALEEKGDLSLDELIDEVLSCIDRIDDVTIDKDVIFMGLGWLVREGFVRLVKEDKGFRVCLREE